MSLTDVAGRLPSIPELQQRAKALTILEVCRSPLSRWGRDTTYTVREGSEYFLSRNGCGDEYSLTFTPRGVLVRGFSHESPMTPYAFEPLRLWEGILDGLPRCFSAAACDPAFDAGFDGKLVGVPAATLFLWREVADPAWGFSSSISPAEEGAEGAWLLGELWESGEEVAEWKEGSLQATLDLLEGRALTREMVAALGPCEWESVVGEIAALGWPLG